MTLSSRTFSLYALGISSVLLLFSLLFRVINLSRILTFFPLDATNDLSSYMAQLFFLHACGYHASCPYWYGGFTNFLFQAPGWYFFTSPLYSFFGDVKIATYISIILIMLLAFFIIFYYYRKLSLPALQRITFFALFFGNAIALGNFLRLGRVHEFFAWTLFLAFALPFFLYRTKTITPYFIFHGVLYGLMILSNPNVAILASVFYLALFFVKPWKERLWLVCSALFGIFISSLWWYPFITHLSGSYVATENLGAHFNTLLLPTHIITGVIMLVFIFLFVLFYRQDKRQSFFYMPFFVLALLVLFRVIAYVPVFDDILIDYYNMLFIFLIGILLFHLRKQSDTRMYLLYGGLLLAVVASVGFTFLRTPLFSLPDQDTHDAYELLSSAQAPFVVNGAFPPTLYSKAIYSYGAIYYNLTTPSGWYPHVTSADYHARLYDFLEHLGKDCHSTRDLLAAWNITSVLSYGETCSFYSSCQLGEVLHQGNVCLLTRSI